MARTITNTSTQAQHDWPDDVFIQGGERGIVFGGPDGAYQTAFVEAFPESTFLRGEGSTLAEAEDKCWKQYQRHVSCDGTGQGHGPYERRQYTNGAGFCTRCGTWMNRVLPPLADEENHSSDRKPSLLDRAFYAEPDALVEIFDALAHADELPHGSTDQ
ncbi:hypothetical protein [Streptomyces sp. NPDC088752]|uniref:hypothetical protein n=1 Tax=Streptomyces sp. NPDC088752 TaxID=3154963 RepID=UPI00342B0238